MWRATLFLVQHFYSLYPFNFSTLFKEETKKEGEAEEEVETQKGVRCGHRSRGNTVVLKFNFINNN